MEDQDCMFCKMIRGDMKTDIQYSDDRVFAIKDIRPQAPTHLLIIPRAHIPTALNLGDGEKDLVGHVFLVAGQIARKNGFAEKGFRIVVNCNPAGGQTVYHLHFHLLGGRFMGWPPG